MFKGSVTPDAIMPASRPGMIRTRKAEKDLRRKIRVNNRCPVCGKLISIYAGACSEHEVRNGTRPGTYRGNLTKYTSDIYCAVLQSAMCIVLDIPIGLCAMYGTPQCRECDYQIPAECPAQDGNPDAWCGSCDVKCRCNGRL